MSRVTNALSCCLPRRLAASERANKLATTAIRLRRLARAGSAGVSLRGREREREGGVSKHTFLVRSIFHGCEIRGGRVGLLWSDR
jgi:hypothetical protein